MNPELQKQRGEKESTMNTIYKQNNHHLIHKKKQQSYNSHDKDKSMVAEHCDSKATSQLGSKEEKPRHLPREVTRGQPPS
jgi:hypothetical protein